MMIMATPGHAARKIGKSSAAVLAGLAETPPEVGRANNDRGTNDIGIGGHTDGHASS